jgi:hypothetical protein
MDTSLRGSLGPPHIVGGRSVCKMLGIHIHNMFQSGTDFWGGSWIRRKAPFREAWVLTPLMAFLISYGPSAFTARLPAGVHVVMSNKGECQYPSVGLLIDTFVRWTPGES